MHVFMTSCTVTLINAMLFSLCGNCQTVCERPTTKEVLDTCFDLHSAYKSALIKVPSNMYTLRRSFFYSPNADPVLLKVNYNITYDTNLTLEELTQCPQNDKEIDDYITNTSQTTHTFGWTSSGVYKTVHPFLLTIIQFQFPFALLRALKSTVFRDRVQDPYWDVLLWNSGEDLSSMRLDLEVEALPCVPTEGQIDATLHHITEQVSSYLVDSTLTCHLRILNTERQSNPGPITVT